tara:strand:- start:147 stop:560 length:414 start_codon:yes stop_codon:yes gene_type:complete
MDLSDQLHPWINDFISLTYRDYTAFEKIVRDALSVPNVEFTVHHRDREAIDVSPPEHIITLSHKGWSLYGGASSRNWAYAVYTSPVLSDKFRKSLDKDLQKAVKQIEQVIQDEIAIDLDKEISKLEFLGEMVLIVNN